LYQLRREVPAPDDPTARDLLRDQRDRERIELQAEIQRLNDKIRQMLYAQQIALAQRAWERGVAGAGDPFEPARALVVGKAKAKEPGLTRAELDELRKRVAQAKTRAETDLLLENAQLRADLRRAREEIETLRKGQPRDGIDPNDATLLQRLEELRLKARPDEKK
jgi:hypothetical protein